MFELGMPEELKGLYTQNQFPGTGFPSCLRQIVTVLVMMFAETTAPNTHALFAFVGFLKLKHPIIQTELGY